MLSETLEIAHIWFVAFYESPNMLFYPENECIDMLELKYNRQFDCNSQIDCNNTTTLMKYTSSKPHYCKYLLESTYFTAEYLNLQDNSGMTALMYAAKSNYMVVKYILSSKFCTSKTLCLQDNLGMTALMYAIKFQPNAVTFILESIHCTSEMLNIQNHDGWTALMIASRYNHNNLSNILKIIPKSDPFIQLNTCVFEKPYKYFAGGQTFLHILAIFCPKEYQNILLQFNYALIDIKDHNNMTCMDYFELVSNNKSYCCPICFDIKENFVVFDPCGHTCCNLCVSKYDSTKCHTCRNNTTKILNVYL